MPCAKPSTDRGSASLEFVTLGLLLLLPLVYLVLALGQLQAGALAADGAARAAARIWTTERDLEHADQAAASTIALAAHDFGFPADAVSWVRSCDGECLTAHSRVTVRVTISVPLPLVPPVLTMDHRARIDVVGAATQTVSRFGAVR